MLFKFGKIDLPLCPFCKMIEETPLHLFYNFLINHIILIYKFYIYNSRNRGYLNFEQLKAIIDKTKKIEEEISKRKFKKRLEYLIKWRPFTDDLV